MNGRNEGKNEESLRVTVLGARGSMPVSRPDQAEFGGATACFMLEARGEALFLDAGTGLMNANVSPGKAVSILLTHPHADHLLGLPMFLTGLGPGGKAAIYGAAPEATVRAWVDRLISPPLWPCTIGQYPCAVTCKEMAFPLELGVFTVTGMASCHPGGSVILRVSAGGKSVVYATDFEHTSEKVRELAAFSAGADLILYDGQYTPAQFEEKRGFGHSTAEMGLRVLRESGAAALRVIHHDPFAADARLKERESALGVPYARQGEVIAL